MLNKQILFRSGKMRFLIIVNLLVVFVLLGGCSTPQKRAGDHPELMESLSSEEREMVEAGEVDIGFTEEMVLVALGEPDRKFTERRAGGEREIWVYYGARRPNLSLGVGAGMSSGRSSSVGGGVSVGSGSRARAKERYRLIFEDKRVAEIARAD